MNPMRFRCLIAGALGAALLASTPGAWAQQKYTISRAPSSTNQYLQEHIIAVDDVAGHQLRVFEQRYTYPQKDYAFAGVQVKENLSRGISDYVNLNGPFTQYSVYTLEDGNKVYSRITGTTQSATSGWRKFVYVENFVGGTGKFKGIRGQLHGSGERAPGENSLKVNVEGEYWIEE